MDSLAGGARAVIGCGLLVLLGSGVKAQPAEWGDRQNRIREHLAMARYDLAEREASLWHEEAQLRTGPDSDESWQAASLLRDALIGNGRTTDDRAVDIGVRILRRAETRFGPSDARTAEAWERLGEIRLQRGEFLAALTAAERALGPPIPATADRLDLLALSLLRLERFTRAADVIEQSLQSRRDAPAEPRALARSLAIKGWIQCYTGKYADAALTLEEALRWLRPLEASPLEAALTLEARGLVRYLSADVPGAEQTWADAAAMLERVLRPDHPAVVPILRRRAYALFALGDFSAATQVQDRVDRLVTNAFADCHPETGASVTSRAIFAQYEGDYRTARELYGRRAQLLERCRAPGRIAAPRADTRATLAFNMAELAFDMGDLREAEGLYRNAAQLWAAAFGPNHQFVARALDALAESFLSGGQLEEARATFTRALTIRRRAVGLEHPDVAWTLVGLARAEALQGKTTLAEEHAQRALDIYRRAGPSDEPDHLARALVLRGELLASEGRPEAARASLVEALSLRDGLFGSSHPFTAEARAALASVDFALGDYEHALEGTLAAEAAGRDHLRTTVRYLPERPALLYAVRRARGLDLALTIVADRRVAPEAVVDSVIRSRGLVLEELAARARTRNSVPTQASHALSTARERFANLLWRSVKTQGAASATELDAARVRMEEAERQAASLSVNSRNEEQPSSVTLNEVRRWLPSEAALVSFVRYDRTLLPGRAQSAGPAVEPSYLVFVTRWDTTEVSAVPLGSASSLEALVAAWRELVGSPTPAEASARRRSERDYRNVATRLRVRAWDPLRGYLEGARRVFVVPDGAVNLVNFAALPDTGEVFLVETAPTLHYLSAERDLVSNTEPVNRGILAVGGPTFTTVAPRQTARNAETDRFGCQLPGRLQFNDLPGARAEAEEIVQFWAGPDEERLVLTGRAAQEATVKRQIVGRQVVHLATHGFFLTTSCRRARPNSRAIGAVITDMPAAWFENPLLRSGLALANANDLQTPSRSDDGLLTAEEIAGLDLAGTQWAVLSACDTGVGEIRAGEGVFGLRRALQIAGARTVIMSLWPVEDQSTRRWMGALYAGKWGSNLSTADAIRAASLQELSARRARGASTHPFYWAAFVAAGDWR